MASGILALAFGALTFVVPDDSISQLAAGGASLAAAVTTAWLWLRRTR